MKFNINKKVICSFLIVFLLGVGSGVLFECSNNGKKGETVAASDKKDRIEYSPSMDYEYVVNGDIDGDKLIDIICVEDIEDEEERYTQLVAFCGNGKVLSHKFEDACASHLAVGDLSGDGISDILVVRHYIASNYGGCDAHVFYVDESGWKEYPYDFYTDSGEFSFSLNYPYHCLIAADIREEKNHTYLRLIYLEDAMEDIVKCVDSGYQDRKWHIEESNIIEKYYEEKKYIELLGNF